MLFLCVFHFFLYHLTYKHISERASKWGIVGFLLSFEYAHMNWDLSWPWLTLGNGFAHMPWLIQWYEYTGVFGGSLWVLMVNVWVYHMITNKEESWLKMMGRHKLFLPFLITPIIISLWILFSFKSTTSDKRISISVIQPNYEPHYQKFYIPATDHLAKYVQLIKDNVASETDYVLLPETAFSRINVDQNGGPLCHTYSSFDIRYDAKYVSGNGFIRFWEYGEDDIKPDHLFTYCNSDRTVCRYIDSYNASIQLEGGQLNDAEKISFYKKSKLVPGAESMPL